MAESDIEFAKQVLDAEANAVARIEVDEAFDAAVGLVIAAQGGLVVSGIGKSGLVGRKLSATFASTGTPSHFLHATEAMHGDLGRIRKGDVVLLLSYGGNTQEVVELATILRQDRVPIIAILGQPASDLGRLATVNLCVGDVAEACPLNLAPTASTTAMLALGDALALAVSRRRGFGVEDFQKVHPGGGLGRQLTPVVDAMRFKAGPPEANLALIVESTPIADAFEQSQPSDPTLRRAGALLVVDDAGRLAGIFTDGDLRRLVFQHDADLRQPIARVMTRDPRRLDHHALVRDAVQLMRETRIDEVPVVDGDGRPLGLIDVQDLVALKVIEG